MERLLSPEPAGAASAHFDSVQQLQFPPGTSWLTSTEREEGNSQKKWLRSHEERLERREGSATKASPLPLDIAQDGQGSASRLYRNCVLCMHHICRSHRRTSSSGHGWLMLREEMDAFFLWAQDFEPKELEQALSLLDDLQDSVLECLIEIGKVLQRARLETIMEDHHSETVFEDLREAMDLMEQRNTNSENSPSELKLFLANSPPPSSNIEIEELTKELQPHIRHLVDLSPIIHQNLEIAALKEPPKALLSSALIPDVSSVLSTAPSSQFKDSGIGTNVWPKSTQSNCSREFESRKSIYGRLTQEDLEQEDSQQNSPFSAENANTAGRRPYEDPSLYHCLAEGCSYSSTRAYDVKRHMNMHNPVRTYPCPYSWCGRDATNPFGREDHLMEHLQRVHSRDIPKRTNGRQNRGKGRDK